MLLFDNMFSDIVSFLIYSGLIFIKNIKIINNLFDSNNLIQL
jgi:hypothetical protein